KCMLNRRRKLLHRKIFFSLTSVHFVSRRAHPNIWKVERSLQGAASMEPTQHFKKQFFFASVVALTGALAIAGCQNQPAHPDEKAAVTNSLKTNNLGDVSVSQDRDKGVMTLTGDVNSEDLKSQAAVLAKQAAPDYTISDEIGVRPQGAESQAKSVSSNLDSAIEDNYKAAIKG